MFATEERKKLRLPSFLPNLSFFKRYDCGSPHHGIIMTEIVNWECLLEI